MVNSIRAQAVASADREAWGRVAGLPTGMPANIIFTGQMFSAGGKRNNKYAGTPHFHDWSVASTKSTALFRVCTHILPAWSVAEGHPGSMQKCVCVCVCIGDIWPDPNWPQP